MTVRYRGERATMTDAAEAAAQGDAVLTALEFLWRCFQAGPRAKSRSSAGAYWPGKR